MSKIALRIAGVSLASALACSLVGPANAQLLTHKDISLAMATTIALTAIETCKAQGYNVSAHVVGREGQVIVIVEEANFDLAHRPVQPVPPRRRRNLAELPRPVRLPAQPDRACIFQHALCKLQIR